MSNNTYYILRHGETFNSKSAVEYGENEYVAKILPEGVFAIERIAEYLKTVHTDFNFTSEILRCRQTAEIVAKITGKKFTTEPLINEYLKFYGESFNAFCERIKNAVRKFESETNRVYLLCTHGAVISALKHLLTTGKYNIENLTDYPKTGTLIIIQNGKIDLKDFNTP